MSTIFTPNLIVTRSGIEHAMTPGSLLYSDEGVIFLNGEINEETSGAIISQLLAHDKVSERDVTLLINSPGGNCLDGYGIIDIMDYIKPDVSTVCVGKAASMAAIILAAGAPGKRFIARNAEVMIHQPLGGIHGQASDISRMCEHITKTKDNIIAFLAQRTGNSKKKLIADMDRDYWMSASEAVKYGLADKILKGGSS